MMKAILIIFILFSFHLSFGQFKHEQNAQGDPLTEIIDANGMKQGRWNYIDSQNRVFRYCFYSSIM